MRNSFVFFLCFITSASLLAQSPAVWRDVEESTISLHRDAERQIVPQKYRSLQLDLVTFQAKLQQAAILHTSTPTISVDLPMPDGNMKTFDVWESAVMESGLAAKYAHLKTYKVQSQDKMAVGRFSYTPKGFHANIKTEKGMIYIDPYATQQTTHYISYYQKNHVNVERQNSFKCELSHEDHLEYEAAIDETLLRMELEGAATVRTAAAPVQLRNYRLALATTAEYSARHGSTTASVMQELVVAINRVNTIMEAEVGVHLNLVDGNDVLIFLNTETDGYTNGNTQAMIGQNPGIINSFIPISAYDIGHVFGTNAGGLAQLGSVCGNGKARGVTCHGNPVGDGFYIDYVCHEMGHQFGGPHTFNKCDEDNENPGTAYEPGSGSTIMSYSGLCGFNNLQFDSDPYYHIGALERMIAFMHNAGGNTCADHTETNNNTPVATIPFQGNFTIPIRTPFELEGEGFDEDGDPIYYCWEQYNLGPISDLGDPAGNAPIMRSYPPTTNPIRTIPHGPFLLSNTFDRGESLPTYTRDLTFRLTVRDYNAEAGAVHWDEVKFKANEQAGPFLVMQPTNFNEELMAGSYTEITWDVANTDVGPVNCKAVDIYLSTDGGNTFSTVLLNNTPNDGSAFVTIPNIETDLARVKIKAADNIFFDISDYNFKIIAPTQPGYALELSPRVQQVCLPTTATIDLDLFSFLGYDETIAIEVIDGLPEGATVSIANNPVNSNNSNQLVIDLNNVTEEGAYNVTLQATAPNTAIAERDFTLVVVSNDFSALVPNTPADGTSGVSTLPEFTWTTSENAISYTVEIATSPSFEDAVIDTEANIIDGTYTPSLTLDVSTLYYWRVIPNNECGDGKASRINAFHTPSFNCAKDNSLDTPIAISASGAPSAKSEINVLTNGIINDINVPVMRGNHEWFSDLEVTLTSPAGTKRTLFEGRCSNYNGTFDFSIDDEAPTNFQCPPTNGKSFRPSQSLSAFNGESTEGTWTLDIKDNVGGSGGSIKHWELEFCASVSVDPPFLVINEPLPVNPGSARFLNNGFLLTEDNNNVDWQLKYTLVKDVQHGTLLYEGEPLQAGDEFNQADIFWENVRYVHDGSDTDSDFFTFTVRDDEGGWTGTHQFDLVIDPDIMINTNDLDAANTIDIYPNPAAEQFTVQLLTPTTTTIQIDLINVHGQTVAPSIQKENVRTLTIPTANLASGVYFVKIRLGEQVITKKISVL